MEFLAFLLVVGFVVVVVGAIMGMIAKTETGTLDRRLDAIERELRALRREQPVPPPPAQQPAKIVLPPPLPATVPPPAPPAAIEPEPVPEPQPPRIAPPPLPEMRPAAAAAPAATAPTSPGQIRGVEAAVGMRWLTWVGVGLLFLGIAFFLKYAYDRDWLGQLFGPRLRIAAATGLALGLAICGWRSLRSGMTSLGQGLLGGGQALLYLTIFAAFQPAVMVVHEPLLGTTAAFACMVLVSAAGLAAAVRLEAIAMAFLAVLGGFATPVLVSTGADARDLLFAYLLLLDLGVVVVASYRRWRALDLLAFAGTVVLFAGWFAAWYHHHAQPDLPTLLWLGAFHLVFLLLPFAHHWRYRSVVPVERFALALANVAWTLGYAAWMLQELAPRLLAGICLAGALLYLGLGLAVARRVDEDRRTRDGFLALAALLLTLGVFYLLPVNGITTAWFAEATVLLWLGYRHAHRLTRHAALVVLGAAMVRTLFHHLPEDDLLAPFLWNRWFPTLLVAGLGLGAFAQVHRRFADSDGERLLARACGIGAGFWTLLASSLEILRHANGHPADWTGTAPALAIAWLQIAGTLAFLLWAARVPVRATLLAALLPLLAAVIAVGNGYDLYAATAWPVLNGCCIAGLAVCAIVVLVGAMARRVFADASLAASLFGTAQLALVALATVETMAWLQRGGAQPGAATLGQMLGWVWLLSAAGGGLSAAAWSSRRILGIAALPLALAVVAGLILFGVELTPHRLIANQRFLFALLASGVVAAAGTVLRRIAPPQDSAGPNLAGQLSGAALALLLVYAACESVTWGRASYSGNAAVSWIVWLLGATSVAGSAGGCWRSRITDNRSLRSVALVALVPALILPVAVYLTTWEAPWMFVNARAALIAGAIATALLWARGDERLRALHWVAFAVACVALTAEPPVWFLDHVADRAEAERLALFAVTVTWVVIAVVSLVVGFRFDRAPLRLTALALFGLTAAKLLLLDMSGAQQLYRILAFVLTGIVFVGASWLYHRVERRLAARRE